MARSAGEGQDHYFSARPDSASRPREVPLTLPDVELRLTTDSGVFAADEIDTGTLYLLSENCSPPEGAETILDLGCGYGAIALTVASRAPEATVWAVDVNERALDLTRRNASSAGLTNVVAATPERVPADLSFAAIYSNPPIRIGKTSLHELLLEWLNRLGDDAAAVLVVQKHLGSDSLQRWLNGEGWPTERLSSRSGYRLLEVRRS